MYTLIIIFTKTAVPLNLGNHAIACVTTDEEYGSLKSSLSTIITDTNQMINDGCLTVNGKLVEVEFFLGGDYKVIIRNDHNIIKSYGDTEYLGKTLRGSVISRTPLMAGPQL